MLATNVKAAKASPVERASNTATAGANTPAPGGTGAPWLQWAARLIDPGWENRPGGWDGFRDHLLATGSRDFTLSAHPDPDGDPVVEACSEVLQNMLQEYHPGLQAARWTIKVWVSKRCCSWPKRLPGSGA